MGSEGAEEESEERLFVGIYHVNLNSALAVVFFGVVAVAAVN